MAPDQDAAAKRTKGPSPRPLATQEASGHQQLGTSVLFGTASLAQPNLGPMVNPANAAKGTLERKEMTKTA